jgi:hypothetical protein
MSPHAPPTPHDPTPAEAKVLFDLIATKFPTATLGPEKWYILVLAALVSGGQPQLAAPLYTHLIAQPEYQTPEQRQRLMRRLRETLFKLIVIVGVCRPLEAVLEIESVLERDEDRDWSFSRWVFYVVQMEVVRNGRVREQADGFIGKAGNATTRTRRGVARGWRGFTL